MAAVAELFTRHGVRPGPWGIPVEFRRDEAAWRAGLALLPQQAAVAAALGADRTATWIMPCDDERDFAANFRFHVSRLTPIAQILAEHGIRFGLEFVGPATLRRTRRHPFVHTLDGMLALAAAVGENVGLLVDSFHLYTAHGALADLAALPDQRHRHRPRQRRHRRLWTLTNSWTMCAPCPGKPACWTWPASWTPCAPSATTAR